MNENEMLQKYISCLWEGLLAQKIKRVVLSPGSRSTPLALAAAQLAQEKLIELYVDVDERSAAFFALGLIKASAEPALIICTSGTAAANYFPAVCEAQLSHLPLLVLTTDRPPELQDIQAPQTIDQQKLYGNHVKHFWQLPLPSSSTKERQYLWQTVQRSVAVAKQEPAGPVQLNLPLRKPLVPQLPFKLPDNLQPLNFKAVSAQLDATQKQQLSRQLSGKRGLIIAGPQSKRDLISSQKILEWAQANNWPIIADPLSNLRSAANSNLISTVDFLCRLPTINIAKYQPEVIIQTGSTLVSAAISNWLKQISVPTYFLDQHHSGVEATLQAKYYFPLSATDFLKDLTIQPAPLDWLQRWQQVEQLVTAQLDDYFLQQTKLSEIAAVYWLGKGLQPGNAFISNSMPIRDVDNFWLQPQAKIFCNRGANGIDGINSTALGMAAEYSKQQNVLLTGDLAFFHDLTGLQMAKNYKLKLRVIINNNNGGGIFSFLPQSGKPGFNQVFGTPQNLDLQHLAAAYQADYHLADTPTNFQELISQPIRKLELIEIRSDRTANLLEHRQLNRQIQTVIQEELI